MAIKSNQERNEQHKHKNHCWTRGFIFTISSYIVGFVATITFICCFESNVYLGLFMAGPILALIGGVTGFLVGSQLQNIRHFTTSWQRSHAFKIAVIAILILSFIWLSVLISIIL